MVIAIDFDGTCVTHEFPNVGKDIGAAPVLKQLVDNGHQLILFTMRSNRGEKGEIKDPTIEDVTGPFLDDAIRWFKDNDIPLYGIQSNPTQREWTTSPKCYAQLYIDDAALGCPLIHGEFTDNGEKYLRYPRPHVDWFKVKEYLLANGLIINS
jgi:hypothetical protein